MGRAYSHVDLEKRTEISRLLKSHNSVKSIAEVLGLHISTVYREIERGKNPLTGEYDPNYAESEYKSGLENKGKIPFFEENTEIAALFSSLILDKELSPEQAIAELNKQGFSQVPSKTTVYAAIDRGLIPGVTRESLNSKTTTVFSDGIVHLPRWVREDLHITDGDVLSIQLSDGQIILKKALDE